MTAKPNELISESSPYLLQHAYNPVHWVPWHEKYLNKAEQEGKLVLVSVGYSACHWCHVMEHESFEDPEVAEIMNNFFICIKVDREERPDIDQIYMTAVQLMTGRGGWPLNCFILPDGKPVYGGSYFPKQHWKSLLVQLADGYKKDKSAFVNYATQLTNGIRSSDIIPLPEETQVFRKELPELAVKNWKTNFDNREGGPDRAPKFPLPNNYFFLLQYLFYFNDETVHQHVKLTLDKMALGGIYDQLGGGFCRYSVDALWKLPHFEKMLYDNAQLVSLYSLAYKKFQQPLYRDVVYDTLEFVSRELAGQTNNFYSALDADSEKEEGKFYVWKKEELINILGNDFDLFAEVFNVNEKGYWEHGNYILLRSMDDFKLAESLGMSAEELHKKITSWKEKLMTERDKRIRPGLDDKTLLSWNALMTTGYLDAYDAFGERNFLETAEKNIQFIVKHMTGADGNLFHSYKNGKALVNGFLEDYSFLIQALIRLYQVTFNKEYLDKAAEYSNHVIKHFSSGEGDHFYFTSDTDPALITRTRETQDNVIPASNSQMAINLFYLGNYFENKQWVDQSKSQLFSMQPYLEKYGSGYSNWLLLWLMVSQPLTEIVFSGPGALTERKKFSALEISPGSIIAGSTETENLELLKGRVQQDKTLIYVCTDKSCHLPVATADEARKVIAGR